MAEEATPVEGGEVQVEPEIKKEAPAPKLDPTKPLSQQTKVLDKLVPETKDEDKQEEVQEELAPKEDEPKIEEVATEEDAPYEEPKELPPVAQYILDNLPEIQTMGHTADGKDRLFKIKRLEDLPQDFEPASRRDELVLNAAISSQEINARELLARYQNDQQQAQVQEFLNQQAIDVQTDIADLQKEGVLPKFQFETDDPKFDGDPAVKEANEIYDLFEKTNKAYADRKQSYRISYRDAADKYYAAKARVASKDEPKEEPKAKPDPSRQQVASKVGAPQGADPSKVRPKLPPGSTMKDILRLYNQGRI